MKRIIYVIILLALLPINISAQWSSGRWRGLQKAPHLTEIGKLGDTDTLTINKHLKIGRVATFTIAASNSSTKLKLQADYICDGTADQVEINNAINALLAYSSNDDGSAGAVLLHPGTYNISGPIELHFGTASSDGKVMLCGEGGIGAVTIVLADNSNCNMIEYAPAGGKNYFAEIKNIRLIGNGSKQTSGHGIYSSNKNGGEPKDLHIYDVFVKECKNDGFHFENAWGYMLQNVLTEANQGKGCYISGSESYMSSFFSYLNGDVGLHIAGDHFHVSNSYVKSDSVYGVFVDTDFSKLTNISIYQSKEVGCRVNGDYNTLSNIVIYDPQTYSLKITGDYNNFSNLVLYKWGSRTASTYTSITIEGNNNEITNLNVLGDGTNKSYKGIGFVTGGYNLVTNATFKEVDNNSIKFYSDNNFVGPIRFVNCGTNKIDDSGNGNIVEEIGAWGYHVDGYNQRSQFVMEGWCTHSAKTVTIGILPADAIVVDVLVWVQEGFNSDGADLLEVGYDADHDAYAASVDVSSTGVKSVTLGATAKTVDATSRTVKIYYDDQGSDATAGKAHVTVVWSKAAASP